MSGGGSSSESHPVSAPYENKVTWSDPTTRSLLTNLGTTLNQQIMGDTVGDSLHQTSAKTLQQLQDPGGVTYQQNPYVTSSLDALRAQNQQDFQDAFAKAYSDVQGYGQGTASRRLAQEYTNYANKAALQEAQTRLGQYNTDIESIREAAKLGLGQDALGRLGSLVINLGDLMKETYGTTPVQSSSSESYHGGLGK